MRSRAVRLLVAAAVPAALLVHAPVVRAQTAPPRIGPWALDLRGSVPRFPRDQALAASRGLDLRELPGTGLGADIGLHVYVLKLKAVTVGIGGQGTLARARSSPATPPGQLPLRPATERFMSLTPQLSLNFGTGNGWSYLSGGIGRAIWSLVPSGADSGPSDEERLPTINYGGGARWFIKPHLAFTFDVRFYDIDPGPPHFDRPGSPRSRMIVIGAGISVK